MAPAGDEPSAERKRRILVVDDVVDAAEWLARLLGSIGHEVEMITDPKRVMEAAHRLRPELVFLDIVMPDIDGYDLARSLRTHFGFDSLRLVALTARGRDVDRVESRHAGFDAHVTKPADAETIKSVLNILFTDPLPRAR